MTPESAIVAECMLALSRAGALVQRNNSGLLIGANGRRVRAAVKGAADILACWRGMFIAVECKTLTGEMSDYQICYRAAVEKSGGIYILARSAFAVVLVLNRIARRSRFDRCNRYSTRGDRHATSAATQSCKPFRQAHRSGSTRPSRMHPANFRGGAL